MSLQEQWEQWVASRPEVVQRLIQKFPPGSRYLIEDRMHFLVGYTEGGGLLISTTNPYEDYEKAVKTADTLCAECLDNLKIEEET